MTTSTTSKKHLVHEFRMTTIRAAASRVVSRVGVAGATIEAIAAEAGIAKGTIYLYFKSREELLEKAADHALRELQVEVGAAFEAEAAFESQLRRFVRSTLVFFDENRQFFRLYQAAGQGIGREQLDRSPRYEEYFERLRAWMRRAMDAGEVRPLDDERVSLVLTEALIAVIRRRRLEESPPPVEADTEWLASLFLYGVLTPRRERK